MDKRKIEMEASNSFQAAAYTIDLCDVISRLTDEEMRQCGTDTYELDSKECPFCHHSDCFKVNMAEEKPYFNCFSCNTAGDVTSFVAKYCDKRPLESLKFLQSNNFNEFEATRNEAVLSRKEPVAVNEASQKVLNVAATYYESKLSTNKSAYAYQLKERGRQFETLDKFNVGYTDGQLYQHLKSQNFTDKDIFGSGLVKENGRDFFSEGSFIYPHFNSDGEVCRFSIKPFTHDYLYQLSKQYWLNQTLFYGENTLIPSKRVIIVEGENDLLSVIDAGWQEGVIATIGQITKEQLNWLNENQEQYHFITCFDDDEAGNNYRVKVANLGIQHLQISSYKGLKDIDEYLSESHSLEELLSSATEVNKEITRHYPYISCEDVEPEYDLCTDMRRAERLVKISHGHVKYVNDIDKWLVFNGEKWESCGDNVLYEAAKLIPKLIEQEAQSLPYFENPANPKEESANEKRQNHFGQALKAEQVSSMKSTLLSFKTMPNISTNFNEFDSSSELIGMKNGVLNLDTGELLESSPDFMITKSCNASFNINSEAPVWLEFLDKAHSDYTDSDKADAIDYLQRFAGASLYGETKDRAFHFLYGKTGTGKSVFTNTLLEVLGDYSCVLSPESIMDRVRGGDARPDLLEIKGARLVVAPEAPQKCKLNEELMKRLTSAGDTMSVRPLYGEPVCFKPQATVILTGNHKPSITSGSDATWQRMRLIEFPYQVPRNEQDKELPKKLMQEADGIFLWAYNGFKKWQVDGLVPPPVIERLTREYQSEQSYLQNFIDDCCEVDKSHTIELEMLWKGYDNWSSSVKYGGMSRKSFVTMLKDHGFCAVRTTNCKQHLTNQKQYSAIKGLKLNSVNYASETHSYMM